MNHSGIKNFGDVIAMGLALWNAFMSALPGLTTIILFLYALMRLVNELPAFLETIRALVKKLRPKS